MTTFIVSNRIINRTKPKSPLNELIIELIDITPKEFFGAQNKNIELLKMYFP